MQVFIVLTITHSHFPISSLMLSSLESISFRVSLSPFDRLEQYLTQRSNHSSENEIVWIIIDR